MHTVELLREALELAQWLGYTVRFENLDGDDGGTCLFRGRKHLFLDLADGPAEQLSVVLDAIRNDPGLATLRLNPTMERLLHRRRAA